MGVDHGGREDKSPRNLEQEDANANCPPQILSYRYKKERSVAFKRRQNPFSTGALSRTPLGELTMHPKPPSCLGRGHPSPYPTPLGTDPPSALAMYAPIIPARSTPMPLCRGSSNTWQMVLRCVWPIDTLRSLEAAATVVKIHWLVYSQ